jgi:hydroxypyruvate isomerase
MVRFSINVSILFCERPFLKRFEAAHDAGFDAVELSWPRGEDLAAVRAARSNVPIALAPVPEALLGGTDTSGG